MKRRKIVFLSLLAIVIVILGFFREHVFIEINQEIDSENSGHLKWLLTFIFIIAFSAASFLFLSILFENKKYALLSVYVYLFLFSAAAMVSLAAMALSSFENVYPFIRTIMGIAQSPVVLLILIPACLLNEKRSS